MELSIKIPKDDTLSNVCGHVGKSLRAQVRKMRRQEFPDLKDALRPWPVARLVKLGMEEITYTVEWREEDLNVAG